MIRPTFLILSQVYVPDPAAVGQHVADAAAEMAHRGYRTIVYTSARGYDDPSKVYSSSETVDGVEVRRLPLSSFGKSSIVVRLLAQWIFLAQATVRGLFTRKLCGLMVSTSPPFCGAAGVIISKVRGVPFKYWLMDLNPDQMVAMKILPATSFAVRVFDAFNRATLRQASEIVVLDRFMAERINRKLDVKHKTEIIPPWPHEEKPENISHSQNHFRRRHVLEGRFVVMYSGNHSPANPIQTLLEAAERMQDEPRLLVMCIGGGNGKKEVERMVAKGVKNIRSLPYQPFDQIRFSLSAADVHVVSIGNDVVGIVHPCKAYGAMALSRPILLLGPTPSHVDDLIEHHKIGWRIEHGDVDGAQRTLRQIIATQPAELQAIGLRGAALVAQSLSKSVLMGRFCDVLQRGLPSPAVSPGIDLGPHSRGSTKA